MKGGQAGSLWRAISFVVNETEPAPRLSKENAVSHALIRLFFFFFFAEFIWRKIVETVFVCALGALPVIKVRSIKA